MTVVDPLRGIFRMERIPMRGFVGVNGCVWGNNALNESAAIGFGLRDGRNGSTAAFTGDDERNLRNILTV